MKFFTAAAAALGANLLLRENNVAEAAGAGLRGAKAPVAVEEQIGDQGQRVLKQSVKCGPSATFDAKNYLGWITKDKPAVKIPAIGNSDVELMALPSGFSRCNSEGQPLCSGGVSTENLFYVSPDSKLQARSVQNWMVPKIYSNMCGDDDTPTMGVCYMELNCETNPVSNGSWEKTCIKFDVDCSARSASVGTATCPNPWTYQAGSSCATCPDGKVVDPENPSTCKYCPNGFVRGDRTGVDHSGCVEASGICEIWEWATQGRCVTCDAGYVGNEKRDAQQLCQEGFVRGRDGNAHSCCKPAAYICEEWEKSASGVCVSCDTGKVPDKSYTSCEFCEDGYVRGPDGRELEGCEAAAYECKPHEFGDEGKCKPCDKGKTPVEEGTACEFCEGGFVRGADGTAQSLCEPAAYECKPHEIGFEGECLACNTGEAPVENGSKCETCPPGQVRGVDGTAETGCEDARSVCKAHEIGEGGMCKPCDKGAAPVEDRSECVTCAPGTVRGKDGLAESGCVPAYPVTECKEYEYAQVGFCEKCSAGKVPNAAYDTCEFCPEGTTRGYSGDRLSGCLDAGITCCPILQYGSEGVCKECGTGQVSNENHSGCDFCPTGTVRGADGKGDYPCQPAETICTGSSAQGKCNK
jgi:hypothetical protein